MGTGDGRTALWRRCQAVVDRLDLPDPFDAETFIAALARRRGRPIELIGVPSRPDRPCGLLVTTARSDLIIYSSDTSTVQTYSHGETGTPITTAPPTALKTNPAEMPKTSMSTRCFSHML